MSQLIFIVFDNENRATEALQNVSSRKNAYAQTLSQALIVAVGDNNIRKVVEVSKSKSGLSSWLVPLVNDVVESRESVIKKSERSVERDRLDGPLSKYGIKKEFKERIRLELKAGTSALVLWLNGEQKPNQLLDLFREDSTHAITANVTVEEENRIKDDFRSAA